MAAQAEVDVVALELERVLPAVPQLFDREGKFYSDIEKRPVEVISNRQMRIPQELRPGGKFGFFNPDGGDLGRGGASHFDKAVLTPAHIKYAVEYTALAGWVTDSNKKAVINNVQRTLAKAMIDFRRHCDTQAVGNGDGWIATITAVSTAAGIDTYTLSGTDWGAKLLRFNQDFNIFDTGLDLCRNVANGVPESTVSFYDIANKQIQANTQAGVVATDKIVCSGLQSTPPVGIHGVLYHHSNASTGTWLGYNRATTPEIRANGVNGNSNAFALPLARLAVNLAADRVGEDELGEGKVWMHPNQVAAYEQLGQLVTILNSPGENKGLDRYFGGTMQMAGWPVKKSFNWHRTRMDFVNMSYWGRGELHPASFYEVGGRRLFEIRGASGGVATSTVFYLTASFDLFVTNPAGCSYIYALALTSGY